MLARRSGVIDRSAAVHKTRRQSNCQFENKNELTAADPRRFRVETHRVAVNAGHVGASRALGEGDDGEWKLPAVERLGEDLEVRRVARAEPGPIHQGQLTGGSQSRLHGINDQEGVALRRQRSRLVVKLARDPPPRVTLAHARLHDHGLDEQTRAVARVEGFLQRRYIFSIHL